MSTLNQSPLNWVWNSFGNYIVRVSLRMNICVWEFHSPLMVEDIVSSTMEIAHPNLQNNLALCLKCLNGLMRRLEQSRQMLQWYNSMIRSQLQQGIIEIVSEPTSHLALFITSHFTLSSEKTRTLQNFAMLRQNKMVLPSMGAYIQVPIWPR